MLVVAGLSDGIDGLLARKLNQRSALGAYLDPIADKLLLSSSFIILAFKQKLAWWLTIIVSQPRRVDPDGRGSDPADFRLSPVSAQHLRKTHDRMQILLVFMVVLAAAYPHPWIRAHKSIF